MCVYDVPAPPPSRNCACAWQPRLKVRIGELKTQLEQAAAEPAAAAAVAVKPMDVEEEDIGDSGEEEEEEEDIGDSGEEEDLEDDDDDEGEEDLGDEEEEDDEGEEEDEAQFTVPDDEAGAWAAAGGEVVPVAKKVESVGHTYYSYYMRTRAADPARPGLCPRRTRSRRWRSCAPLAWQNYCIDTRPRVHRIASAGRGRGHTEYPGKLI